MSTEHLRESNNRPGHLYQSTSSPTNIHENVNNNCNMDNGDLSLEQLMDLMPSTRDDVASAYCHADRSSYTVSDDKKNN